MKLPPTIQHKLKNIKCLICDVDGVLSDGRLYLTNSGDELKSFHVHDGVGLKLLMQAGIEVAVITTSANQIIENRMHQLGIEHYFCGNINKKNDYQTLKNRLNLSDAQMAYVGDDLPDLPVLEQVGCKFTVANGRAELKTKVDYVTDANGGEGAVREICDLILQSQQCLESALSSYLNA
jgi:3-deoxy-D-manno-octulosonate 8-phosphate phosphatase (KDO 8-P phosphatase)